MILADVPTMTDQELPDKPTQETWRDWLPETNLPDESTWITRKQLLEQLEAEGTPVPVRTLMYWEARGVLPRPVRQWRGSSAPVWYPPWHAEVVKEVASGALRERNLNNYLAHENYWRWQQWAEQWNQVVWFFRDGAGQPAIDALADLYQKAHGQRPVGGTLTFYGPDGERLEPVVFRVDDRRRTTDKK
jgi:hypothetical protein